MSTKLTAFQWVSLHDLEAKVLESGPDGGEATSELIARLHDLEKCYGVYDPKAEGPRYAAPPGAFAPGPEIPELNMRNLDQDDVSAVNEGMIEYTTVLNHVRPCLKTIAALLCGIEFNMSESPHKAVLSIEIKNLIYQIRLLDSLQ